MYCSSLVIIAYQNVLKFILLIAIASPVLVPGVNACLPKAFRQADINSLLYF
jgi:hypothetical protein